MPMESWGAKVKGRWRNRGQRDVDERRRTGRERTGGYLRERTHAKKKAVE
jgi:hypothetical protein